MMLNLVSAVSLESSPPLRRFERHADIGRHVLRHRVGQVYGQVKVIPELADVEPQLALDSPALHLGTRMHDDQRNLIADQRRDLVPADRHAVEHGAGQHVLDGFPDRAG